MVSSCPGWVAQCSPKAGGGTEVRHIHVVGEMVFVKLPSVITTIDEHS